MDQDKLTPEEQAAFEAMKSAQMPPAYLEDRLVNALEKEGIIKKQTNMNTYIKFAAGIAASLLIFFIGNYVGQQGAPQPITDINPQYGYIMILKEDARFEPGDPMAMFEEYAAWMENLDTKGVKITGQELKPEAFRVTNEGTTPLKGVDEERTTGYFIIETPTEAEALEVVRDNPHLKYGGIIELKSFMNR